MAKHEELYRCLELTSSCSPADIKKAYRRLVLLYHPDKNPDTPSEHFQAIQHAYEILSDVDERAKYDRDGPPDLAGGYDSFAGSSNGRYDLDAFFASLFGQQSSAYQSRSSTKSSSKASANCKQKQRMPDQSLGEILFTMEEGFVGTEKEMNVQKRVICSGCEGSGAKSKARLRTCSDCEGKGERYDEQISGFPASLRSVACDNCGGSGKVFRSQDSCKHCRGERTVSISKKVTILIKKGARSGDRIRLKGEADQLPGMLPGDVTLLLKMMPHNAYSFKSTSSMDVNTSITLTLSEALLGFERSILTQLDGKGLYIQQPPPGIAGYRVFTHGDTFTIKGEGYPGRDDFSRGDLIVKINVQMPTQAEMVSMSDKHLKYLSCALPPKRENVTSSTGTRQVEFEACVDRE